jgi:hypothetical protein
VDRIARNTAAVVGGLLLLGALAWWAGGRSSSTEASSANGGAAKPTSGFADQAPSSSPSTLSEFPTGKRQPVVESPWVSKLFAAPNIAEFVKAARARPEDGGVYFAFRAMQWCTVVRERLAGSSGVQSAQQARAKALVSSRCESLNQLYTPDAEGDRQFLAFEKDWDPTGRDPLLSAQNRLSAPTQTAADRERIIQTLVGQAGGGGVLLGDLQRVFPDDVVQFQNQPWGGESFEVFAAAMTVYWTERSLASDPQEGGLLGLIGCAADNACAGSATDRALPGWASDPNKARLLSAVQRLYPKLKAALDAGDWSAFIPAKT